jgi:hypothetical protein
LAVGRSRKPVERRDFDTAPEPPPRRARGVEDKYRFEVSGNERDWAARKKPAARELAA